MFPDNEAALFLDSDSDSAGTVGFSVYADGTTESSPIIRAHSVGGVSRFGVGSTSTTGLLNIGSGSNGDIIYIDGERDWKFSLNGTGASTELNLVDMGNAKPFSIVSPTNWTKVATFIAQDTNTSERVYLTPNGGRTGIGTTSPTQLLDVRGNANITGIIYTPQLCLNGDCQSSWPVGGSSSGMTEFGISNGSTNATVTNQSTIRIFNGSGITVNQTGTGLTIQHADTSVQASSDNSGRTYIQDIVLDGFGHITSIVTATETVTQFVFSDFFNQPLNTTSNVVFASANFTSVNVTGNITTGSALKLGTTTFVNGTAFSNSTCTLLYSPNGGTRIEICN